MEIRILLSQTPFALDERSEQENRSVEAMGQQRATKCVLDFWIFFPHWIYYRFTTASLKKIKCTN